MYQGSIFTLQSVPQLVSIFKAFQINFKAGALPFGREGLATSGSSECHPLITSFLTSGLSPQVGFSFLCFLPEKPQEIQEGFGQGAQSGLLITSLPVSMTPSRSRTTTSCRRLGSLRLCCFPGHSSNHRQGKSGLREDTQGLLACCPCTHHIAQGQAQIAGHILV